MSDKATEDKAEVVKEILQSLSDNKLSTANKMRKSIMDNLDKMDCPKFLREKLLIMAIEYSFGTNQRVFDLSDSIVRNVDKLTRMGVWVNLIHLPQHIRERMLEIKDLPDIMARSVKADKELCRLPLAERERLLSMAKKE